MLLLCPKLYSKSHIFQMSSSFGIFSDMEQTLSCQHSVNDSCSKETCIVVLKDQSYDLLIFTGDMFSLLEIWTSPSPQRRHLAFYVPVPLDRITKTFLSNFITSPTERMDIVISHIPIACHVFSVKRLFLN